MTDEGPEKREESEEDLERRLRKLLGEEPPETSEEQDEFDLKLQEIEDRLTEVKKEASKEDIHQEFEERFRKLEERAAAAKSIKEKQERQTQAKLATDRSDTQSLGLGLSIAYAIVGLPLLGAAIGWFIDSRTGSDVWKGGLALAGAVIGLVHAITMLNKHQK